MVNEELEPVMGAGVSFPRRDAGGKQQKKAGTSENKRTSYQSHERKDSLPGYFSSAPSFTSLEPVVGDYQELNGQRHDKDKNSEKYQQLGNGEQQEKDLKGEKGRQQGQNPANHQQLRKDQIKNNALEQKKCQNLCPSPRWEHIERRLAFVEKQQNYTGASIASKYLPEYEEQVLEPAGISLSQQFGDATLAEHTQYFCKKLC